MLAIVLAVFLLAADPAALRLTAMGDASWQRLIPGAEKGPEVATVLGGASLSQTLLRLGKDASLPPGQHDVDATLVLLEGELTVEAAGRTFPLTPGAVLEIPKGTRYAGRTKWDKKALCLITLAGAWSRAPE